ncbi:unnamed protein product, partial [marine sediment metagenome]
WKHVFKKKPKKLVWNFPIQTEGLLFYYQRSLHPDHPTWADKSGDGDPDHFRPENIVGSYAVYHATRTNMHSSPEDAEKYKAGKAFHLYYPYLEDADGWRVRAEDFRIENGLLKITLPQDFMNVAVYPVVVDPEFGWHVIGGADTRYYASEMKGSLFTSPADTGTANFIAFYVRSGWFGTTCYKGVLVLHSTMTIVTGTPLIGSESIVTTYSEGA